ncbi:MAG: glycosyltransferase [Nostocaceae cyanobacterium]|nr:glycosyltransferase [Nostocaceae cyanobacterium]
MLSQRKLKNSLSDCGLYEFEDVICDLDAVDMFSPVDSYEYSKEIYKWVKRVTRSTQFANFIRPDPNTVFLDREYELFYVILRQPHDVFSIFSLKDWRKKSKKAVCHLIEIWNNDVEGYKPLLELLKDFDHIFLGVASNIEKIAQITGRPCTYVPASVDAIKFCPYPLSPNRSIDVTNIGRRSTITHQALVELAQQKKIHYLYDTVSNARVPKPHEHRSLLANQLKRSRYFIANRPMANRPDIRGNQAEIGYRFFEGAAAGTVMIGDSPDTAMFNRYFDWEDAVIRIPFDAPNIADIIADLDAQPERLARIRRDNVVNSLLRHDWVYRWKQILEIVNLPTTKSMFAREVYLKDLAKMAQEPSFNCYSVNKTKSG